LALALTSASAFTPNSHVPARQLTMQASESKSVDAPMSRRDAAGFTFAAAVAWSVASPEPAFARGRSTQIAAWARYGSRVEAMRSWLVGDFKALVNSGDFEGLKAATNGKKGVVVSYVNALDLWAASYSDANPSAKTVAMQADVAKIRQAVAELNVLAKKATGEDLKKEGGFFGLGAKEEAVPTGPAMVKLLNEVAQQAKDAYNDYCDLNNEGHPFEVDELVGI